MKMKKKLLSFVMVAMLVIPLAGIAGAGKVEAADVTDQNEQVVWWAEEEKMIPQFSDSFNEWFYSELGFTNVTTYGDYQGTLGPNSVLKIDWDKTTIPKDRIIGIKTRIATVGKYNGEYDLTFEGGDPYVGIVPNHPANWGGDANYTPSEPINPEYLSGAPWYYGYEEPCYLADWVKQDSFPGLKMSTYYNELVEFENERRMGYGSTDLFLFLETGYLTETGERRIHSTWFVLDKPIDQYVADFKEPTESGEIEEVDLSNQESQTISNEDFNKLIEDNKEKDIVIKNKDGLTFTFPKGSLSAVEGKTEYDFGTTFVNEFAAGTLPEFVTASNFVKTISFGYSGKLPGKATIKIPLGAEYAGKTLYYSYVKESGLTETQQVTADAEGNITVTQDHCSDYVITTENPNPTQKSPQTGDNQNLSFLLILMVASAAIAGTIIMRKRTVK